MVVGQHRKSAITPTMAHLMPRRMRYSDPNLKNAARTQGIFTCWLTILLLSKHKLTGLNIGVMKTLQITLLTSFDPKLTKLDRYT